MMNKTERKQHLTMTVIFSAVVFLALFAAMVIVGGAALLLLRSGDLTPAAGESRRMSLLIVVLMLASTVVGAVLSGIALRMPLKPVNRIIHALNRLADGRYDTRIYPQSRVERMMDEFRVVRELNGSFNTLAGELESTELLRSDFINNFSHEFKTPIVSIAGFAKLLKRGNLSEAQKNEYLDIIEEESLRLSAMATNVLNLTKVENQSILTDIAEFNLSEQLRTCVLLLESKWERKHLTMELDFDELTFRGSEELLKQVWINLLDNAVKFADEGSTLRLSAAAEPSAVTVTVENEGPDIPEAAMTKIYNKFYQADESHAAEGNGVGLAIVKRVTELHGGTVTAVSGGGKTAFTVRLPQ